MVTPHGSVLDGAVGLVADPLTARGTSCGSRPVISLSVPCVVFLGSCLDLVWTLQESLGFSWTYVHIRSLLLLADMRCLLPLASIVTGAPPDWQAGLEDTN